MAARGAETEAIEMLNAIWRAYHEVVRAKGSYPRRDDYVIALHPANLGLLRRISATSAHHDATERLFGLEIQQHHAIPGKGCRVMRREDWRAIEEEWSHG